jgi:hypothetical protein
MVNISNFAIGEYLMRKSYPVSARVSEDSKKYLEKLVDMGIAINTSEALKLCIRFAKQNNMEEKL